uniref:Uncharacterized protein n=1 Tax=Oryza brachyantha TaxID=4533 RepID=J3LHI7_ORYBR
MAPEDAGPERGREPAADVAHRRPPVPRLYAFQLMLLGATAIVGACAAAAAPVSLPRLFLALVIWLVGCLSLFVFMART